MIHYRSIVIKDINGIWHSDFSIDNTDFINYIIIIDIIIDIDI